MNPRIVTLFQDLKKSFWLTLTSNLLKFNYMIIIVNIFFNVKFLISSNRGKQKI
jgi:hypothetical protein